MKKQLQPTLILIGILLLIGGYLYAFTETEVFWGGFFAMITFYGLIFYFGTYVANRKSENTIEDVMLAGRNMPLYMAVFTMSATWLGGGFINGTAEYTYTEGFGLMWVQAPWGYALSLIVGGLLFARKMRNYEFKTMLDPLVQRFGKRMGAVLFIPALTGEIFWTAAILTALGTTFATVLGLDFQSSIIISAIIAIAYTAIGGLWSVAMTDIVQMILLFAGLIIILPFALQEVGGWEVAWSTYQEKKGGLASFFPSREVLGDYYWIWWDYALLLIFGGIAWQVYFQRVLASKNAKIAVQLSIIAGFVCMIAAIPPIIIGIIGDAVPSWEAVGASGAPENPAIILPYVVRYLTPEIVATIGLGAIAAAVMSSVDSSILSASSMASWNVYRPLIQPNVTADGLVKVIKRCIWIIGITATLLALKIESVYELWFLCSDFVFCLLFPQLFAAFFDKKANVYGSIAGFTIAFILRFGGGDATLGISTLLPYPLLEDGAVAIPFRTIAMVSGLLSIALVSRLTQHIQPANVLRKVV